VKRIMDERLEQIKNLGAVLIDPVEVDIDGSGEHEVLLYEFKAGLNAYLARLGPGAPVSSLTELIEFNARNAAAEMPFFGQELFIEAEQKGAPTEAAYNEARSKQEKATRLVAEAFEKHGVDAFVAPTGSAPWLIDLVNGDAAPGWPHTSSLAAHSGCPHITVPAGWIYGLPVGLSLIGPAYSEPALLSLAYAFEQATRRRRAPSFLPTADLEAPPWT
jgi:amidase